MNLLDALKELYDLAKKAGQIPLQERILDLRGTAMDLRQENLRLAEENASLLRQLELQLKLTFDGRAYWNGEGREHPRDGPYCARCFDAERMTMHLQLNYLRGGPAWWCPQCKRSLPRRPPDG